MKIEKIREKSYRMFVLDQNIKSNTPNPTNKKLVKTMAFESQITDFLTLSRNWAENPCFSKSQITLQKSQITLCDFDPYPLPYFKPPLL